MNKRRPIIAGNWKMHMTIPNTIAFLSKLKPSNHAELIIAPPFTALSAAIAAASPALIAAQNMHFEEKGAFTGEISPVLIKGLGCSHVILGHSERRHVFHEDDVFINKKLHAALVHGLTPILCIGEKLDERESGSMERVLASQLAGSLHAVSSLLQIVIAYEPVWAIGTGRVATPTQAQEAHSFIRKWLSQHYPRDAESVRILYGGSVKADNAHGLMSLPDIDGVLVGGASLDADSFNGIVAAVPK